MTECRSFKGTWMELFECVKLFLVIQYQESYKDMGNWSLETNTWFREKNWFDSELTVQVGVLRCSLITELHYLTVLSMILWIYLTSCYAYMQRLRLDLHLWGLLSPEVKGLPGNRQCQMIVLALVISLFIQVDGLPLVKVAPCNRFALTAAWKLCNLWIACPGALGATHRAWEWVM